MKIKIYSRLSIDTESVHKILPGAEVAEPVQRGQISSDITGGFNVVAIIDGQFDQNLAVTPSEIMEALRAGVRIYGSSSMGALRAAECEKYGAIGCGKIFEYIKNSPVFRDDYLGQLYIGRDLSWQTKTYIDFYFAALDLVKKKKISKKTAGDLCEIYEELFYAERSEDSLLLAIAGRKKSAAALSAAARLVFNEKKSQKTKDAEELLHLIKKDIEKIKALNTELVTAAQASPDPLKFYPRDLYL